MTWDLNLQLSLAFVGNSLLLILGESLFFCSCVRIFSFFLNVQCFAGFYNSRSDSQLNSVNFVCFSSLSKWSKFYYHRYFDWTDRYVRFLAYEITTVNYSCRNTDFCLAPCDYSRCLVWASRKDLRLVIGLFTGLSFNRSSILNFSLNLSDF